MAIEITIRLTWPDGADCPCITVQGGAPAGSSFRHAGFALGGLAHTVKDLANDLHARVKAESPDAAREFVEGLKAGMRGELGEGSSLQTRFEMKEGPRGG